MGPQNRGGSVVRGRKQQTDRTREKFELGNFSEWKRKEWGRGKGKKKGLILKKERSTQRRSTGLARGCQVPVPKQGGKSHCRKEGGNATKPLPPPKGEKKKGEGVGRTILNRKKMFFERMKGKRMANLELGGGVLWGVFFKDVKKRQGHLLGSCKVGGKIEDPMG